jgi:transposase
MQDDMDGFLAWERLSSRGKAVWPARDKGHVADQHTVEISLDTALAWWVTENVVGRSSFAFDLEETVVTALRVIAGDLPVSEIEALRRLGAAADAARRQSKP